MRTPDQGEVLLGNDRFEGFCKDLAELISKKLGIGCKYNCYILIQCVPNSIAY